MKIFFTVKAGLYVDTNVFPLKHCLCLYNILALCQKQSEVSPDTPRGPSTDTVSLLHRPGLDSKPGHLGRKGVSGQRATCSNVHLSSFNVHRKTKVLVFAAAYIRVS